MNHRTDIHFCPICILELETALDRVSELETDHKNIHTTLDAVADRMDEFAYQELSSNTAVLMVQTGFGQKAYRGCAKIDGKWYYMTIECGDPGTAYLQAMYAMSRGELPLFLIGEAQP